MMPSPREDASGDVILQCEGLVRRFGTRTAVDQLSIRVNRGDVYGILGPNGAGKTTAMRCILGLIRRDAGQCRSLALPTSSRHAARSGPSSRRPLSCGCPGETISGRRLHIRGLAKTLRVRRRVLDRVGLTERAEIRAAPQPRHEAAAAIARALLGRPQLLLLDEPTNDSTRGHARDARAYSIVGIGRQDHHLHLKSSAGRGASRRNRVGIILTERCAPRAMSRRCWGSRVRWWSSEARRTGLRRCWRPWRSASRPGQRPRAVALTPIAEVVAELVRQRVAVTAGATGRTLEDAFLR